MLGCLVMDNPLRNNLLENMYILMKYIAICIVVYSIFTIMKSEQVKAITPIPCHFPPPPLLSDVP